MAFDNIAFVLNAVDVLAGEETLLPLRRRRTDRRTLTTVEAESAKFVRRQKEQVNALETTLEVELEAAQLRMDRRQERIEADETLSPRAKQQLLDAALAEERQALAAERERQSQALENAVRLAKAQTERDVARIQTRYRLAAVGLAVLPAACLGLTMLLLRLLRERRELEPDRIV